MGLDLYIEARIREKKTGRIISSGEREEYEDEKDKGYFEVCWWCSWIFCDVRTKMIEICNQHLETNYTDSDEIIPVPQSALREIYAYLVERSYLPDNAYIEVLPCNAEWQERSSYEKMNLINANKLHDLLWTLSSIEHDNVISIDKIYIPDINDLKLLEKDSQAYGWEFRIMNSY